ncbi:MAG: phage tail protein [Fimbriimonadaceae bacterium]|nr:phage tail protein [Fimbriimonadaceae bacterium]
MAEPFIGEIKLVPYNFAPRGWAFCNGTLISIAQNTALFALLGTMYGGNGQTNFALPDLRGRGAISSGQGPGLSNYSQGETGGAENVTLTTAAMPAHGHSAQASSAFGTQGDPAGALPAKSPLALGYAYRSGAGGTMPSDAVSSVGGGQPHTNHQPYLVLNYVIAMVGIFPPRN